MRVRKGVWLVPESFVEQVLPQAQPPAAAPRARRRSRAPACVARGRLRAAVTLEELRSRSYPSFTRVVLETTGAGRSTGWRSTAGPRKLASG